MYSPGMPGKIVNACATLRNICIHCYLSAFENCDAIDQENNMVEISVNQSEPEFVPALIAIEKEPRTTAQRIRKQLILDQFGNFRDGNNDE